MPFRRLHLLLQKIGCKIEFIGWPTRVSTPPSRASGPDLSSSPSPGSGPHKPKNSEARARCERRGAYWLPLHATLSRTQALRYFDLNQFVAECLNLAASRRPGRPKN